MPSTQAHVLVIGGGPAGYTAAFRAADLLKKPVVLVEKYPVLGGVCLNVGCIPSKALLHVAGIINELPHLAAAGIDLGTPKINLDQLRAHKDKVVNQLNQGLGALAKQRKITVITGEAAFVHDKQVQVTDEQGQQQLIDFEYCIVAAGSRAVSLPNLPESENIIDSTGALALKDIPKRMLIIGGGIIGMEMAAVYHALGTQVSIVELSKGLLGGVDSDLSQPLLKMVQPKYHQIMLGTKVTDISVMKNDLKVSFEGEQAPEGPQRYDVVLSAVGRRPNGDRLAAEKAGVTVNERGFMPVNTHMQTNVPHIFAVGDIVGDPMLAHKGIAQGRVAAEVIAGEKHTFEPRVIPSVAYTDPEVAWVGVLESEAKAQGIAYGKGVFPWMASGRALGIGRGEGLTKLLFDKETHQIIGAGIVGPHAGDLINEVALAIEMGCEAEDIALTIHAHPTLSETIPLAAEMFEGTITDLMPPRK